MIMNLRKLHTKGCAIELSSFRFLKAPSETWKNKNAYCKTHNKIFGTRWCPSLETSHEQKQEHRCPESFTSPPRWDDLDYKSNSTITQECTSCEFSSSTWQSSFFCCSKIWRNQTWSTIPAKQHEPWPNQWTSTASRPKLQLVVPGSECSKKSWNGFISAKNREI